MPHKTISENRKIFLQLIQAVCEELGYEMKTFSQGWIVQISYQERRQFILGHRFGINPDASAQICRDKTAASMLLTASGIPNIEHVLVHAFEEYLDDKGFWGGVTDYFKAAGGKVVIKPNEGSGGEEVMMARNQKELELAVFQSLQKTTTICLSPFVDIKEEYRVVVLLGEIELVFKKKIAEVCGDGQKMLWELIYPLSGPPTAETIAYLKAEGFSLKDVLPKGQTLKLFWKHNLGLGARPLIVDDEAEINRLRPLAIAAMNCLGMSFASVDIVEDRDGKLQIIEVNAGIMMVNLAASSRAGYEKAYSVYKKVVETAMG